MPPTLWQVVIEDCHQKELKTVERKQKDKQNSMLRALTYNKAQPLSGHRVSETKAQRGHDVAENFRGDSMACEALTGSCGGAVGLDVCLTQRSLACAHH